MIALGGNAIVGPGEEGNLAQQYANTTRTMREIARLVKIWPDGRLVITHGNGPQVGNILLRSEEASHRIYPLTLDVCVSDSEGGMGYMIQQILNNELAALGFGDRDVVTIITQTVVDPHDPAFADPSKFIGQAYSAERAEALRRERGWTMKEDKGRGWRRVVASPEPRRVVEARVVERLLKDGVIVIAAGGGGIPVAERSDGRLFGVECVVDKDLAAALLARAVGLDTFVILTGVERVCLNFGTPQQEPLARLTVSEARAHLAAGQFPPGSMGPKIEACARFLEGGGRRAVICAPGSLQAALRGETGTEIVADGPESGEPRKPAD
ncbi:MAG: carbamate kinase [Candidatus Sumerlaeia bacterium]